MKMNWNINLQLFSQEKTEQATPKKRQEARKKGQVAKSPEISAALIMLVAFLSLGFLGPWLYRQMLELMRSSLSTIVTQELTISTLHYLSVGLILFLLKCCLPLMLVIVIIALASNLGQVGFLLTTEPLTPKLEKLDPIKGFQRIFSKRALVELAKSLFKVTVIGYLSYVTIKENLDQLILLMKMTPPEIVGFIASLTYQLGIRIAFALLLIAFADYAYQRWEHEQSLKMSKHEVKEEHKMVEGNPQIKGKIREKQRQMAMRRMMQAVPKADVVITNPTHLAIALKYEPGNYNAPFVLAKGEGLMAQRIKEIAKEHKIVVMENKPLAQALYKSVEINQEIPPELYQAVAEILAFVFKLKRKI